MEFRTDVTLGLSKPLEVPLMNGGGCIKTVEDVREAAKSLAGAIVVGSFTVEPRTGNEGNVWHYQDGIGLNSLGMPNGGAKYLRENLSEMVKIAHDSGKYLVVNVAGFKADDYVTLTSLCVSKGADAVELNFGCPNVVTEGGTRKPIISYNLNAFSHVLNHVAMLTPKCPLWVKVSPNLAGDQIELLAQQVVSYKRCCAVTAINTVPNTLILNDEGKPVISVGLAGMSGKAVKPIGLGQVYQWRKALDENGRKDVQIIGVGGISSGEDILDYQRAGADAFQMTTELLKTGKLNLHAFASVVAEYDSIEA